MVTAPGMWGDELRPSETPEGFQKGNQSYFYHGERHRPLKTTEDRITVEVGVFYVCILMYVCCTYFVLDKTCN